MKENNIWLVRPFPHGSNHMQDFLDKNIIAVGYPLGFELSEYDYGQIRYFLQEKGWEEGIGNVNNLVHEMNIGDLVVIPDGKKDVYFAQITSDYKYVPSLDENKEGSGYPHQREVKWFFDKKPLLRSELPERLRGSMRFPGTIADLTKHYEVIYGILSGEQQPSNDNSLEDKARRVISEMLDSDNPELRLRAAEIILKR